MSKQVIRRGMTYPGSIEPGVYIIENDVVILTDAEGTPLPGEYRHELQPGQDVKAMARMLLRQMLDRRHRDDPFGRPLRLPPISIA